MLILGKWQLCANLVSRPIVESEVLNADGDWMGVKLLLDSGADRTVLSNDLRSSLGLPGAQGNDLGGVGGTTSVEYLSTQIRLTRSDNVAVTLRGEFAAFLQDEALDMSVLGRDITNLFAVIIDKPGDAVCLLGQQHRYQIVGTS